MNKCPSCGATPHHLFDSPHDPTNTVWSCLSHTGRKGFTQSDECRVDELQTQVYTAMTLVDEILDLKVTEGTGTCETSFLDDVKKARKRVEKLKAMEAKQIAVTEARSRLEEML